MRIAFLSLAALAPQFLPALAATTPSLRGGGDNAPDDGDVQEAPRRELARSLRWTPPDRNALPIGGIFDPNDDGKNRGNGGNCNGNDKFRPNLDGTGIAGRYIVSLNPDSLDDDDESNGALFGGRPGQGAGLRDRIERKADSLLERINSGNHGIHDIDDAPGKRVGRGLKLLSGFVATLPEGRARALANLDEVMYVEQDGVATKSQTDAGNWGLDRIDQRDLPLDGEYMPSSAYRGGEGVVAYVIDTGIRVTHDEFQNQDGTSRARWGDNFEDNRDEDCDGHGTHVAGSVGGNTYGVAKSVELVAVKVLDCGGSGAWSSVIAGVEFAVDDCPANKNCVANMSLGGGKVNSVNEAVNRAVDDGLVFAVAAGNDNDDARDYSPAGAAKALTVGSMTNRDERSSFSNYGSGVDLFAPGSSIKSALADDDSDTGTYSGTSMASPHVCGAAALLWAREPSLTSAEVNARIVAEATDGAIDDVKGAPNKLLYVDTSTADPTTSPTNAPSRSPTPRPTGPSASPSLSPTRAPTRSPTMSPTRDEAQSLGFDLAADGGFRDVRVSSGGGGSGSISETEMLHVRIYAPGPSTVAPGYPSNSPRIDWTDMRKAEYELKLNAKDREAKGNLQSLDNGYYTAGIALSGMPLGWYEVKLKLEDNDGNKVEFKSTTDPASAITVTDAIVTGAPSRSPTPSPTASPVTPSPTASPVTPLPTASPVTPSPTSAPTMRPTSTPTVSPTRSPTSSPTKAPTSSPTTAQPTKAPSTCALPTAAQFIAITTDGCTDALNDISDLYEVNLSDRLTLVLRDDDINGDAVSKIEIEFKVEGDKDRKTKYKIERGRTDGFDESADFFHTDSTLPYAVREGGVVYFKLEIDVGDIGKIGGNANGDDNDPVTVGEGIEWKFKVFDADGGQVEYRDQGRIQVVNP